MEMHVVTYNGRYNSFHEASTQPDGLAVIMFMIEVRASTSVHMKDYRNC